MPLTESDLSQFTGTENYHRYSPLFRRFLITDGVKYLAENAGAYWLLDAIASHQLNPKLRKGKLAEIQFWTLEVKDGAAVLVCKADSNCKPAVTQNIEHTDFPLPSVKLYVQRNDDHLVCCLPSEY